VLTVVVFITASFAILTSTTAHTNEHQRKWSIGLGNPYISLKYSASPKFSIEARGAFGSGINVYSLRVYNNFSRRDKTITFIGAEAGTINFDKADIEGNGYLGMIFLGFEHFISKRLTFLLDIGPAYVNLASEGTSVGGVEWVYNLGIGFYFR